MGGRQLQIISGIYTLLMDLFVSWRLRRCYLMDLGYIDSAVIEKIKEEIQQIERMLKGLIKSLENKHLNP